MPGNICPRLCSAGSSKGSDFAALPELGLRRVSTRTLSYASDSGLKLVGAKFSYVDEYLTRF